MTFKFKNKGKTNEKAKYHGNERERERETAALRADKLKRGESSENSDKSLNSSENAAKNSSINSPQNSLNLSKNSTENLRENFANLSQTQNPTLPQNFLKTQNKKLKSALFKAYFVLFKEFKRLYFGSNFKLKFYEIYDKIARISRLKIATKNSTKKLEKWRLKHKERKENFIKARANLKLARKSVKFLKEIAPQSEIWLKSPEFKAKYIDTKHPFPPLLNPANIDYESISAEFAWEMNLPLPPHYDFIYISNGSSASAATFRFLQECGVNFRDLYSSKEIFSWYFDFLRSHKDEKNAVFFYSAFLIKQEYADQRLLHATLSAPKPLFYIARDPIEKLEHHINHLDNHATNLSIIRHFNLTFPYEKTFPKLVYIGSYSEPNLEYFKDENSLKMGALQSFVFDTLLKTLKPAISQIHCIEFNDLKGDKAFGTFCQIADTLGFARPKNAALFTNRINRNRGTLTALPTTLYAHESDLKNCFCEVNLDENSSVNSSPNPRQKQNLASLNKSGGFSFIITLPHYLTPTQQDFADITDEIEPNLTLDDTRVLIIIEPKELAKIRQNAPLYSASISYLKGYVKALRAETQRIKNSLISEAQILDFFAQNEKPRKLVKALLDSELSYIKANHPEFLKKWKYYGEFERICAQLDGADKDAK